MESEFNVVLAREHVSNRLPAKFMNVESTMDFLDVRDRMLATAKDFFLLRIPEIQLANGNALKTSLCYVCSSETAIRKIGRLFTIEAILSDSPKEFPLTR
ncbi:MAG: hypothetical protein WAQ98_15460 [Blastocatellia bacterium]